MKQHIAAIIAAISGAAPVLWGVVRLALAILRAFGADAAVSKEVDGDGGERSPAQQWDDHLQSGLL